MSRAAVNQHHHLNNLPAKACHNCRQSRLRCDKSLPGCEKCHSRGISCLGYGKLLRWTNNVTAGGSRPANPPTQSSTEKVEERAMVMSLNSSGSSNNKWFKFSESQIVSAPFTLVDPAFQDLDARSRAYISHCPLTPQIQVTQSVCQDLVSFDQLDQTNPFRYMTALLGSFDYLREIILATSAVHMVTLRRCRDLPHQQELVDALAAKGRAIHLLRRALGQLTADNKPIVMIAIAFFINFDLIDSGRGQWKTHIEAAGSLISSIQGLSRQSLSPSFARLADSVVADCITYHILGAGFASPADPAMSAFDSVDIVSTLQRGAAFSYGCCPPLVLNALLKASRLSPENLKGAVVLLEELQNYDTRKWVYEIPDLSPNDDLEVRVSMAQTHRLATMLYIGLAVSGSLSRLRPATSTDSVLSDLLHHLAAVPLEHVLAKGVIWPTFMAGAQADDESSRQWCFGRMEFIWHSCPWICPWGYIEAAIDMLQRVWRVRDVDDGTRVINWLQDMRGMRDHCLIV